MSRAQVDRQRDRLGGASREARTPESASGELIDHDLAATLPEQVSRPGRPGKSGNRRSGYGELSAGDEGGRQTRDRYGGLDGILEAASHRPVSTGQPPLEQPAAHQAPLEQAPIGPTGSSGA